MSLNLCLNIDLVLTLKSPFMPANRRLKWYVFGSVTLGILMGLFTQRNLEETGEGLLFDKYTEALIACIVITIYFVVCLFALAYAFRLSTRPGMSKKIRQNFITGHTMTTVVYMLTWTFYLAQSYYMLYTCAQVGVEWTLYPSANTSLPVLPGN